MANPTFIPAVFAQEGIKNPIQKDLQTGQPPESFTWTKGAPLITMTPIENGGAAPLGQDFNGALNTMCEHAVYGQNGGRYTWSNDVITNYGGYAKGAIVQSDDTTKEFISLVDSNANNPNSNMGGWAIYSGQGSIPIASSSTAGITRVLNVLNSNDTGAALSAAQGSVLAGRDIGIGQSYVNVTSSRSLGLTYTNSTNKPILVIIVNQYIANPDFLTIFVNNVQIMRVDKGANGEHADTQFIVPPGATYRATMAQNANIQSWVELR